MTEIEAIDQLKMQRTFTKGSNAKVEAIDMGIEALKKQIAKKVITPPCNSCNKELCDCECKYFAVTYRDNYRCPTCDSNGVYMQEYELRFDCCPNCGQKLDWSN